VPPQSASPKRAMKPESSSYAAGSDKNQDEGSRECQSIRNYEGKACDVPRQDGRGQSLSSIRHAPEEPASAWDNNTLMKIGEVPTAADRGESRTTLPGAWAPVDSPRKRLARGTSGQSTTAGPNAVAEAT